MSLGQRNRSCSRQLTTCGTSIWARWTWLFGSGSSKFNVVEFVDLVDFRL